MDTQQLRVSKAFDLIAAANGVTILSLGEMEAIVNRALSGEFDNLIKAAQDAARAEGEDATKDI